MMPAKRAAKAFAVHAPTKEAVMIQELCRMEQKTE
jgi:hypothetical protein